MLFRSTKQLNIDIVSIGGHKKGFLNKLFYTFITEYRMLKILSTKKPDVTVAESNFYVTQSSWLKRIPSVMVAMNDHARLENALFWPFCKNIITSHTFKKDFGKKHIRFNGYLQWLYLKELKPSRMNKELGITDTEKYAVIRLVHWGAHHDIGKSGLSEEQILQVINSLGNMKIFISSENPLPEKLKRYALPTGPEKFQDVLFHSSLCVSEGATVAAEAAILAIPTIYVSSISPGYIEGMAKDGMLMHHTDLTNTEKLISEINQLLHTHNRQKVKAIVDKFDDVQSILWSNIVKYGGAHETE